LQWNGLEIQANTTKLELSGKSLTCDLITVGIKVESTGCRIEYKQCSAEEAGENDRCKVVCYLSDQQIGQPFKVMLVVNGDSQLCTVDFIHLFEANIIEYYDAFIEEIANFVL
jgi:hypothetical protein